jgi:hypothetical protein
MVVCTNGYSSRNGTIFKERSWLNRKMLARIGFLALRGRPLRSFSLFIKSRRGLLRIVVHLCFDGFAPCLFGRHVRQVPTVVPCRRSATSPYKVVANCLDKGCLLMEGTGVLSRRLACPDVGDLGRSAASRFSGIALRLTRNPATLPFEACIQLRAREGQRRQFAGRRAMGYPQASAERSES